jgi:protocatechuate 3,4-dioxygenase beta subunit
MLAAPPTAATTEGPFYPDRMPLDTDNDLLIVNDSITPAVGQITHLTGHVLTAMGQPVRNAFVEIWQVDSTASYVHTGGRQPTGHDANFQG